MARKKEEASMFRIIFLSAHSESLASRYFLSYFQHILFRKFDILNLGFYLIFDQSKGCPIVLFSKMENMNIEHGKQGRNGKFSRGGTNEVCAGDEVRRFLIFEPL